MLLLKSLAKWTTPRTHATVHGGHGRENRPFLRSRRHLCTTGSGPLSRSFVFLLAPRRPAPTRRGTLLLSSDPPTHTPPSQRPQSPITFLFEVLFLNSDSSLPSLTCHNYYRHWLVCTRYTPPICDCTGHRTHTSAKGARRVKSHPGQDQNFKEKLIIIFILLILLLLFVYF